MFNKKAEHKKKRGGGVILIFRMFLSLTIFLVLGLGIYQAFRYFSGYDPIKMDPQAIVKTLLSSDDINGKISTILGMDFVKNLIPGQKDKVITEAKPPEETKKIEEKKVSGKVIVKFAIVGDSHNDNENLKKALAQAKKAGAKFVVGVGDYTQVGTVAELEDAKASFASSGLPFYITAGDHDLWDARDKGLSAVANFNEVFGAAYQSFVDSNIRFVILYNSDNYEGADALQLSWLDDVLIEVAKKQPKVTFAFMQEPLYHPSSDHIMGKTKESLKKQAGEITQKLKEAGVAEVFAGDVHSFSRYSDPKTGLKMTTVGAITADKNTQKPRFVLVDVYENGGYNVEDTEIGSEP